jgi:predicted PurR-regulated permease PerM
MTDRGPFLSSPFVARAARWGLLAWSVIGVVLLVVGAFWYVLRPIRVIFPPIVVALIVVYLLAPPVAALERRGVKRVWGTLLVYVLFFAGLTLGLIFLIPVLSHQVAGFSKGIPGLLARSQRGIEHLASRLGIKVDVAGLIQAFQPGKGSASIFLSRLTSFTSGVVRAAVVLLLGPLIAFYLLVDLPKIRRGAVALLPTRRRAETVAMGERVAETLGGFFRGQLVVAVLVGLFSMFGFWLIGLPYFAVLGVLTALLALVPLIGTTIAAIPVLFVAMTTSGRTGGLFHLRGGWPLAVACVIVLVLAQELDTRILGPRLQERSARMHPVTVLLSLLVGGTLLGVWGMLLAVPIVAAAKVMLLHVWDTRAQWPPPRPAEPTAPRPASGPDEGEHGVGEAQPVRAGDQVDVRR